MIAGDRILVVDDSEAIRCVMADGLEKQGFRVFTAVDGQQAWAMLRQRPFFFDLVVTDVMMPEMDGLTLLTNMMTDLPWIKVVLMTGHFDPDLLSRAQALGALAVLFKPFRPESIHQLLRLQLDK